jgi:hypothetical protein
MVRKINLDGCIINGQRIVDNINRNLLGTHAKDDRINDDAFEDDE